MPLKNDAMKDTIKKFITNKRHVFVKDEILSSILKDVIPQSLFEDLVTHPLTSEERKHIQQVLQVEFLGNLKRLYAVTSRARYG